LQNLRIGLIADFPRALSEAGDFRRAFENDRAHRFIGSVIGKLNDVPGGATAKYP
jgi:hypothetical protein